MALALAKLKQVIEQAFDSATPPECVTAWRRGGTPPPESEEQRIIAEFEGKTWQELMMSPDLLELNQFSLFQMQAATFRYYLPAFLIVAIEHPETEAGEPTLFAVEPRNEAYNRDRLIPFSPDQQAAILAWLEYELAALNDTDKKKYGSGYQKTIDRLVSLWSGEAINFDKASEDT